MLRHWGRGRGKDERSILGTGIPTPIVVLMIAVMGFYVLDVITYNCCSVKQS